MFRPLLFLSTAALLAACGKPPAGPAAPEPTASAPPEPPAEPAAPGSAAPSVPAEASSTVDPGAAPTTASATARPAPIPETGVLPPLPKGSTVLHVGDSMADALGKDLRRELQKRGVRNVLKYQEATFIPQWAGYSMSFRQHVAIHKPDLVIITLGGNEVAMPDPTERAEDIRTIVSIVGDRPCIWVAAPLWGPHSGILNVIRQNCAPCRFVDTNALIPDLERLGDKVHPTLPERRRWARFMVRWLAHNRDPDGERPWDLKAETSAPPPGWELP